MRASQLITAIALTFALVSAAVAFEPDSAYARQNTDTIRASFERDLNHEAAAGLLPGTKAEIDPLDKINAELRGNPSDPFRASFERELSRCKAS